mmetsp:Transcript_20319/g.22577  ORF Transcript_20319/g.22577 Transcript_20319/m.22577 type:complete len:141 (-) Transcript_20319:183-605(-)
MATRRRWTGGYRKRVNKGKFKYTKVESTMGVERHISTNRKSAKRKYTGTLYSKDLMLLTQQQWRPEKKRKASPTEDTDNTPTSSPTREQAPEELSEGSIRFIDEGVEKTEFAIEYLVATTGSTTDAQKIRDAPYSIERDQ